jgi:toxin-antitoxin system PIN domain toxin
VKIVDVNILLYITNTRAIEHGRVKAWWDAALRDQEQIGLPWHALISFVRISTLPNAFPEPLTVEQAVEKLQSWIAHPNVSIVQETKAHATILVEILRGAGKAGKLTTDAHFAALAISHNATLVSCDNDFARFRRLKWENPLAVP